MPAQPYNRARKWWCALSARSSQRPHDAAAIRVGRDTLGYDSIGDGSALAGARSPTVPGDRACV